MAKKVKKTLTLDEKLEAALVPVGDQPYAVPENWCWTNFSELIILISGRDAALSECNDKGIGIPYILGASNLNNNTFSIERWIENPQVASHKGDILLSVKGTIGKLYIQKEDLINISRQIMAIRPHAELKNKFIYLFLLLVCEELKEAGNGLIPGISRSDILEKAFPLPPLPEQHRIVNRIESLFAKLDEAKEAAQAVVDGFEDCKAAILHKAFTGELTAEWRVQNSIEQKSWKQSGFDDCIEVMQNGLAKRRGDSGQSIVVLRLANLGDDGFDESDLREILLNQKEQDSYELHLNDVLMIRVNGSKDNVGKQYQVLYQKKWAFCDHIIRIRYSNEVLPEYMVYYSKSESYRRYIEENMVSSAGQNTISRKGMKGLMVPVPTIIEQKEIVEKLKHVLGQEQQAKSAAESVIDQIDTMKKSILARAFRGELGTNDPNDEPAIELLKRVLAEKVQPLEKE